MQNTLTSHTCAICLETGFTEDSVNSNKKQKLNDGSSNASDNGKLKKICLQGEHYFHPKCFQQWLDTKHSTCPICREELRAIIPSFHELQLPDEETNNVNATNATEVVDTVLLRSRDNRLLIVYLALLWLP